MLSFERIQESFPSLFPWCSVTDHLLVTAGNSWSLLSASYVLTVVLRTLEALSLCPIESTSKFCRLTLQNPPHAGPSSSQRPPPFLPYLLPSPSDWVFLLPPLLHYGLFSSCAQSNTFTRAIGYGTAVLKTPLMASPSLGGKPMAPNPYMIWPLPTSLTCFEPPAGHTSFACSYMKVLALLFYSKSSSPRGLE